MADQSLRAAAEKQLEETLRKSKAKAMKKVQNQGSNEENVGGSAQNPPKSPEPAPVFIERKERGKKASTPKFSKVEPPSPNSETFIPDWRVRKNNSALGSAQVCKDMVMNGMLPRDVRYMKSCDRSTLAYEAMHASVGSTWRSGIMAELMLEGEADIKNVNNKLGDLEKEKKEILDQMETMRLSHDSSLKMKDVALKSSMEEVSALNGQISALRMEKIQLQERVDSTQIALEMLTDKQVRLEAEMELKDRELELAGLKKGESKKSRQDSAHSKARKGDRKSGESGSHA